MFVFTNRTGIPNLYLDLNNSEWGKVLVSTVVAAVVAVTDHFPCLMSPSSLTQQLLTVNCRLVTFAITDKSERQVQSLLSPA